MLVLHFCFFIVTALQIHSSFIHSFGDGSVALWSTAAPSDRTREHWKMHGLHRCVFWFYRDQPLHLWSPLGLRRRRVNCEYARFSQFHRRNEL